MAERYVSYTSKKLSHVFFNYLLRGFSANFNISNLPPHPLAFFTAPVMTWNFLFTLNLFPTRMQVPRGQPLAWILPLMHALSHSRVPGPGRLVFNNTCGEKYCLYSCTYIRIQ